MMMMMRQVLKPAFLLFFATGGTAAFFKAQAAVGEISVKQALALSSLNQNPTAAEEDQKLEMQNEDQIRKEKCCDRMQKGGDAHGWSPQSIRDFLNADSSAETSGAPSSARGGSSKRGASGLD